MKQFLTQQFSHFKKSDFDPREQLGTALLVFISWALPAFIFVVWANTFYPEVQFYQDAITEGIGPNLWNAIGAFGLFLFGITVIFSRFNLFSIVATNVLSNTYAIGSLTFGLIVGQWFGLVIDSELVWWHRGLFGVTSGFLLLVLFSYNLAVWYLCFLIQGNEDQKSEFLVKLEAMHWIWRLIIGLGVAFLVAIIFLSEK